VYLRSQTSQRNSLGTSPHALSNASLKRAQMQTKFGTKPRVHAHARPLPAHKVNHSSLRTVTAAATIRNAPNLLTSMPTLALASASPKCAVQTATSTPRSAPASAKSR
jgi:hypothetical protein